VVEAWALRICPEIVQKGGPSAISPGLLNEPDPPTRLESAPNLEAKIISNSYEISPVDQ
jgi:hypothetical protein